MTDGFEVLVQLVMAAITTQPFSSLAAGLAATAVAARPLTGPPSSARRPSASELGLRPVAERGGEALPDFRQRSAVLRALGSGEAGLDLAEVQLEHLAELRRLVAVLAEQALLLRVALDQVDLLAAAAGDVEVAQRLRVDREQGGRRAVLRAHVAQGGAVRNRKARQPVAAELDELLDHAVLAQHLGEGQHQVGRGRAGRQRADEPDAHDDRGGR